MEPRNAHDAERARSTNRTRKFEGVCNDFTRRSSVFWNLNTIRTKFFTSLKTRCCFFFEFKVFDFYQKYLYSVIRTYIVCDIERKNYRRIARVEKRKKIKFKHPTHICCFWKTVNNLNNLWGKQIFGNIFSTALLLLLWKLQIDDRWMCESELKIFEFLIWIFPEICWCCHTALVGFGLLMMMMILRRIYTFTYNQIVVTVPHCCCCCHFWCDVVKRKEKGKSRENL